MVIEEKVIQLSYDKVIEKNFMGKEIIVKLLEGVTIDELRSNHPFHFEHTGKPISKQAMRKHITRAVANYGLEVGKQD